MDFATHESFSRLYNPGLRPATSTVRSRPDRGWHGPERKIPFLYERARSVRRSLFGVYPQTGTFVIEESLQEVGKSLQESLQDVFARARTRWYGP